MFRAAHPVARLLLREAGKVARRAGWGAESRDRSMKARLTLVQSDPKLRKRTTPHPDPRIKSGGRATFPSRASRAGEGKRPALRECLRRRPKIADSEFAILLASAV